MTAPYIVFEELSVSVQRCHESKNLYVVDQYQTSNNENGEVVRFLK